MRYGTGDYYPETPDDVILDLEEGLWLSEGCEILAEEMEDNHLRRAINWCSSRGYEDTDAYRGLVKEWTKRQNLLQESGDSF